MLEISSTPLKIKRVNNTKTNTITNNEINRLESEMCESDTQLCLT